MSNIRPLCGYLILTTLISVIITSGLFAASWDSFKPATFTDISLDKPFQANVLNYTLTLGSMPTITIDSKTFTVNWVQAFYVMGGDPNVTFTAINQPNANSWSWDSKFAPSQISGWKTQAKDQLKVGNSIQFCFASFDPHNNLVVPGFHISFQDGNNTVTDWFKAGALMPMHSAVVVPEPSALAGICIALSGLVFFGWHRKAFRFS